MSVSAPLRMSVIAQFSPRKIWSSGYDGGGPGLGTENSALLQTPPSQYLQEQLDLQLTPVRTRNVVDYSSKSPSRGYYSHVPAW